MIKTSIKYTWKLSLYQLNNELNIEKIFYLMIG